MGTNKICRTRSEANATATVRERSRVSPHRRVMGFYPPLHDLSTSDTSEIVAAGVEPRSPKGWGVPQQTCLHCQDTRCIPYNTPQSDRRWNRASQGNTRAGVLRAAAVLPSGRQWMQTPETDLHKLAPLARRCHRQTLWVATRSEGSARRDMQRADRCRMRSPAPSLRWSCPRAMQGQTLDVRELHERGKPVFTRTSLCGTTDRETEVVRRPKRYPTRCESSGSCCIRQRQHVRGSNGTESSKGTWVCGGLGDLCTSM